MIPYADFSYFALMLYPVIPTLLLGLIGRINWRWVFFITVVVLGVQFARTLNIVPETTGGHHPSGSTRCHNFSSVTPGSHRTKPVAGSHSRI